MGCWDTSHTFVEIVDGLLIGARKVAEDEILRCVDTTRFGVGSWLQEFYFELAVSALLMIAVKCGMRECG